MKYHQYPSISETPKSAHKIVLVKNLLKSQKGFIDSAFEKMKIEILKTRTTSLQSTISLSKFKNKCEKLMQKFYWNSNQIDILKKEIENKDDIISRLVATLGIFTNKLTFKEPTIALSYTDLDNEML